jgi:3-(3-hydroxy-phenyl)propionate hydroxylase
MPQGKFDCDVAIVGASPTGLMTALQLGQAGVRVCLLEKRAEPHGAIVRWLGRKPVMVLVRPDRIVADVLSPMAGDGQLDWITEAYRILPAEPAKTEKAA